MDGNASQIEKYEVYRSEDKDVTYTQNFYNLPDKSLTLLKARKPVELIKNKTSLAERSKFMSENQVKNAWERQKLLNDEDMVGQDKNKRKLNQDLFVSKGKIKIKIKNS